MARLSLAASLAAVLLGSATALHAADPPTGTLTTANTRDNPVSYVAGPISGGNQTTVCDPVQCDEFELTVSLPADYDSTNPDDLLVVEINWPDRTNDFELYVLDADRNMVASAVTGNLPEVAVLQAGQGEYTLFVQANAFAAANESIEGTIYLHENPVCD